MALGTASLTFTATSVTGRSATSNAKDIQVFPPLRLDPRVVVLIRGATFQVMMRIMVVAVVVMMMMMMVIMVVAVVTAVVMMMMMVIMKVVVVMMMVVDWWWWG